MISVESIIQRARRDLKISAVVNGALFVAAAAVLVLQSQLPINTMLGLTAICALYAVLALRSMRGSRMVADSPMLIAAGQYDAAEQRIDGALRSFSIFRAVKLISLHHLATLRHAQSRWQEAAALCRALLGQKSVAQQGLGRSTQLMLADSLLELSDVRGAGDCIMQLYMQRLTLGEALSLLSVQLDYESRMGAWQAMMNGAATKVSMSELMPTAKSARAQALLALAAKRVGRQDWESWLRRRVELLVDPQELMLRRPLLKELWLRLEAVISRWRYIAECAWKPTRCGVVFIGRGHDMEVVAMYEGKSRYFMAGIGMIASILLMVAALWGWSRAGSLSADATRPEVVRWAVRSGAIAVAAVAQLVLLTFVAGELYRHRRFGTDLLRVSAGLVAGIALVSAVALGLAGR